MCSVCLLRVVVYSNVHVLHIVKFLPDCLTLRVRPGGWRDFLCSFTFISFQQGLNALDRDALSLHTSLSFLSLDSCGLFLGGRLSPCVWFSEMSCLPLPTVVASQTLLDSWRVLHENFLPFRSLQQIFVLYVQNAGPEQVCCPSTSRLWRVWKMQWLVCVFYFFIYFYSEGCLQISCVDPCPVSCDHSAGQEYWVQSPFWVGFQESTLSCSPHSCKNLLIVQLFFFLPVCKAASYFSIFW